MCTAETMCTNVPLVDPDEWGKYTALPKQLPAPTTTAARVHWWKARLREFPKLAPVCIAYWLSPKSASQSERSFSHLRHIPVCFLPLSSPMPQVSKVSIKQAVCIQTDDRLHMANETLQALAFTYMNKGLMCTFQE